MDTIERHGVVFKVELEHSNHMHEPWKEHDGHGVVTGWLRRDKCPGERVLSRDRSGLCRYYDVQETQKIALRDGWGINDPAPGMTRRQIAAAAVEQDYQRLRAWCRDEWYYADIIVTHEATELYECLGGVESDDYEHIKERAGEMADELYPQVIAHILENGHAQSDE